MSNDKELVRAMFQNRSLILQDTENNTLVDIVASSYMICINNRIRKGQAIIPEFYEISDECLEYVIDNGIKTVTWKGMRLNSMSALDLSLRDILEDEGFIYEHGRKIINPYQLIMFEDLE